LFGYGYGISSEVWTFGCLIYEMLTGNPPFRMQEEKFGIQEARQKLYNEIKYAEPDL
jgi:serine/threonine protein kinase